jgi:N6-adenosine-specific RNA methylase IME4
MPSTESIQHALTTMHPEPDASASTWAARITACWRQSAEAIFEAGRLLKEAKQELPHGDWQRMCERELPFKLRTAERLMRIAADERLANPTRVSLLPPSWGTLYELTGCSDEQIENGLKNGTICADMERSEAASLKARRTAESRRQLANELSDCAALQPTGRKFPVLYADPAWQRKAGIGNRAYENTFPTMDWQQILAMPVASRLLPDAWGFVWIPRAHLLALVETEIDTPLGRCLMKVPLAWAIQLKWGFDSYSTCAVWTKTDDEFPDDQGTGLIFFDQDELLLVFKKGRGLPKPDSAVKFGSNHRERSTDHSAKPPFYRGMINAMTGNLPVLELFAREDDEHVLPPNFFTWGNQSKNTAEREAA